MHAIIEELHRSFIRLIDLADAQHQERIILLRVMVKELEFAHLLNEDT
jgi:hypothetical protein